MRPDHAEKPECIMIVEDEFLIRASLAEYLRALGYRVIEAFNAEEALIVIDKATPDLIITDVRMPGAIDGLGLLARVREEHPGLPVIVASGHLEAELAIAGGAAAFLPKPFTYNAVVDVAKSALKGR